MKIEHASFRIRQFSQKQPPEQKLGPCMRRKRSASGGCLLWFSQSHAAESKLIDRYTISTGIYENIASGKDCSLSDYMPKEEQSRYCVEVIENISPQEHGKFIVADLEKEAFWDKYAE